MKTDRTPVPRKGHGSAMFRVLEVVLFATGLAFVGVFSYVHIRSWVFERVEGRRLDEAVAQRGLKPSPSDTETPARGALLGRIEIPRAGVYALIVEGAWDEELDKAVGRIVGTARFGERGTVALAAHRDRHFRGLRNVGDGDTLTVTTPQATYAYVVDSTRVTLPEDVELSSSAERGLTLMTCYPFGFMGHAPKRFLVYTHQLDVDEENGDEAGNRREAGKDSSPLSDGGQRLK